MNYTGYQLYRLLNTQIIDHRSQVVDQIDYQPQKLLTKQVINYTDHRLHKSLTI